MTTLLSEVRNKDAGNSGLESEAVYYIFSNALQHYSFLFNIILTTKEVQKHVALYYYNVVTKGYIHRKVQKTAIFMGKVGM